MKKALSFLWRGTIVVSRDILNGFIMGICSALLLLKINPALYRSVALLIVAGLISGIFKGTAKFIFLNLSGTLTGSGYRYNYPKFKILLLWLVILFGTLIYNFGFNVSLWFTEPLKLMKVNTVLGIVDIRIWVVLFSLVTVFGIISYVYEIPVNKDQTPSESEEQ